MKQALTLFVLLLITKISVHGEDAYKLLKVGTRTYTNVIVTNVKPDEIFISHTKGSGNIKIKDLPPELHQKYGPKCENGKRDCPAPCLKLHVGKWEHLKVAGHKDDELWQVFRYQGGWQAWSQNHLGEVIEYRDGKPMNIGKCKTCGGSTKVKCDK